MKATEPIKEGDQVFDDHGEIPRSDLLRRYGYVSDSYSPYDVIELSLESICEAAGLQSADPETEPQVYIIADAVTPLILF